MDKKSVVNFSSFFQGDDKKQESKKSFKKEDFEDFFIGKTIKFKENNNKISEIGKRIYEDVDSDPKEEDLPKYPKEVEDIVEEPKIEDVFDPPFHPEDLIPDEHDMDIKEEESVPSLENDVNFNKVTEVDENYYTVFKDKFENFHCNVAVEGAKLYNTKARLILETEDWNLVFDGDIDKNGRCTIPIKKLNILDEGCTGKIRLEVIAENTIFTPWEDDFKVKMSKKVEVEVPRREIPKEPSVRVNFGEK